MLRDTEWNSGRGFLGEVRSGNHRHNLVANSQMVVIEVGGKPAVAIDSEDAAKARSNNLDIWGIGRQLQASGTKVCLQNKTLQVFC